MNSIDYIINFLNKISNITYDSYFIIAGLSLTTIPIVDRIIGRTDIARVDTLIVVQLCACVVFFFLSAINISTNLAAANKLQITNNFRQIFWEIIGSFTLAMIVAFLAIAATLLDTLFTYVASLWCVVFSWLIIFGIQFRGIGDNYALTDKDHKKPQIFVIFDRIFNIIRISGEKRIEKTIKGYEDTINYGGGYEDTINYGEDDEQFNNELNDDKNI